MYLLIWLITRSQEPEMRPGCLWRVGLTHYVPLAGCVQGPRCLPVPGVLRVLHQRSPVPEILLDEVGAGWLATPAPSCAARYLTRLDAENLRSGFSDCCSLWS